MIKKIKKLPSPFQEFLRVTSSLGSAMGFRVYLVGGVVRDLILGRVIFDLDIVVEGDAIALAKSVAEHFKNDFRRHHSFGTATVYFGEHKIDFATARKEHYPRGGALPNVSPARLKDDLFRRDFTINTLALSLNKSDYGQIIDLYGGLADLKNRLIRVLHKNSFLDDPTRILRIIRFEQRFSFKIEKETLQLIKEAVDKKALKWVHPHRLRDEIILLLKESKPSLYIKRINELVGFSFIDKGIKLKSSDFKFLLRIEKVLFIFKKKFKKHRKLDSWIIYLAAILIKIPQEKIIQFLTNFDFKKGERIIIRSIKSNLLRIRKLDKKLKPRQIFSFLNSLSFESILFFYAYYQKKGIRRNIEFFLDKLVHTRLILRGNDLKGLGIEPFSLYSRLFQELLYAKMEKGLRTKQQELKEAKLIFQKLLKKY